MLRINVEAPDMSLCYAQIICSYHRHYSLEAAIRSRCASLRCFHKSARRVFWRRRHAMPCRAFMMTGRRDVREVMHAADDA